MMLEPHLCTCKKSWYCAKTGGSSVEAFTTLVLASCIQFTLIWLQLAPRHETLTQPSCVPFSCRPSKQHKQVLLVTFVSEFRAAISVQRQAGSCI